MPHHFERVGSQQPVANVASSFNHTFCIAPQLFRDLVVRSCVSRFTVNKKAHHLCLVSLLTRKPHIIFTKSPFIWSPSDGGRFVDQRA